MNPDARLINGLPQPCERTDPTQLRSRHFSLAELCHSDTAQAEGIDNAPPLALIANLERLAAGLDAIRELLDCPLMISSGYRCQALNARVGGVPDSQHTTGCAADFSAPRFGGPLDVAIAIDRSAIQFDQLILEFGRWVHVSFTSNPRRRALTIYTSEQGYLDGLYTRDGMRVG